MTHRGAHEAACARGAGDGECLRHEGGRGLARAGGGDRGEVVIAGRVLDTWQHGHHKLRGQTQGE